MFGVVHRHLLVSLLLTTVTGAAIGYIVAKRWHGGSCGAISSERCTLRTAMRKLWADHVIWTRCYLISAIAGLEDVSVAAERLLKNQDDIGAAVAGFYGAAAGKKLAQLLREHIMGATEVVAAAKAKNTEALNKADAKWHENAREIAEFLSKANTHWPYQAMRDMMNEHLALTTQEAVARIGKQWKEDVSAFDTVFDQILVMADHLTDGIAAQFPDRV